MIDLNKIIRPNIVALRPYSSARDEFKGEEGCFLDANENPFGELNRYPDSSQKALKTAFAALKEVQIDNVFIGNGSDEIIDLAFKIFCEPNEDKALSFTPSYGMYEVSAAINSVALIKVDLSSDFQIDLDTTSQYLSDPKLKLIFICSPNNPTGNNLDKASIEFLLQNFDGVIIIDEAYADFSKEVSWVKSIKEYPNLMVTQTMSKAWGLAGARIGTAYANSNIINVLNKVKPPYSISKLNQNAALKAISDSENFEQQLDDILAQKEWLFQSLKRLQIIKKIYPSNANFFLVEVEDADHVYDALVEQKIIIRNRNSLVKNCLRITIGSEVENQQLLMDLKNIKP